jgi:DNA-binding winged helix-turn-helix (wHTH) protein
MSDEEIYRLIVPRRTLAHRRIRHESLTQDESDRAVRIARITSQAEEVFGDDAKAARWLRKPKIRFEGRVPLELLRTEAGSRIVEEMLFLARVRANLRKTTHDEPAPAPAEISIGDVYIDTSSRIVRVRGAGIHLAPKEFDLLLIFTNNPNRVLTHKFLLRQIWGPVGEDQPEYLRTLIAQLRKKLDSSDSSRYIQSEPWVGYRLRNELTTS